MDLDHYAFRFEPEHPQWAQVWESIERFNNLQLQQSVMDWKDDWPDETWC